MIWWWRRTARWRFTARVEPSVDTLLQWHGEDLDRTMLYGVALSVDLANREVERRGGGGVLAALAFL